MDTVHRCTEAGCHFRGQVTSRSCLCHKTAEQMLKERVAELESAALDCAEYLEGIIADMGKCPADKGDDGWCSKLCESYGCMKMRVDHCRGALAKEGQ